MTLPLQYVPVFGRLVFTRDDSTSEPMSRDGLAAELADETAERTVVYRVGELYEAPGTAKAQVTRYKARAVSQYDSHVLVVDLNGCTRLSDHSTAPSLLEQRNEAERLMLYYAAKYDELNRRLASDATEEAGALFAKAAQP